MKYTVTVTKVDKYEVDAVDEQTAIDLVLEGDPSVTYVEGVTDAITEENAS